MISGHPVGFLEAFANLYRDAANAIAIRRSGGDPASSMQHLPDSSDGLRGMQFIEAVLQSSDAGGLWVPCAS